MDQTLVNELLVMILFWLCESSLSGTYLAFHYPLADGRFAIIPWTELKRGRARADVGDHQVGRRAWKFCRKRNTHERWKYSWYKAQKHRLAVFQHRKYLYNNYYRENSIGFIVGIFFGWVLNTTLQFLLLWACTAFYGSKMKRVPLQNCSYNLGVTDKAWWLREGTSKAPSSAALLFA